MKLQVILIISSIASVLAGRVPYRHMITTGLTVSLLASAGLLAAVLSGVPMMITLVLFACFQGPLGLVFSNATALALEEAGAHAGTGSAFLGFCSSSWQQRSHHWSGSKERTRLFR